MAGVFSDVSNALSRQKSSQRRVSLNTGGLARLRGSGSARSSGRTEASGASDELNLSGEAAGGEWAGVRPEDDGGGSPVGGNNSPTMSAAPPQSNWDNNFISLFVS